jgi:SOS-response transcriptional repressor LexA
MVGAGILSGDTLVFRRSSGCDGDVVLAAFDDKLTVKRFRKRARRIVLEPENPVFASMTLTPDEAKILGVLVKLVRAYG